MKLNPSFPETSCYVEDNFEWKKMWSPQMEPIGCNSLDNTFLASLRMNVTICLQPYTKKQSETVNHSHYYMYDIHQ